MKKIAVLIGLALAAIFAAKPDKTPTPEETPAPPSPAPQTPDESSPLPSSPAAPVAPSAPATRKHPGGRPPGRKDTKVRKTRSDKKPVAAIPDPTKLPGLETVDGGK